MKKWQTHKLKSWAWVVWAFWWKSLSTLEELPVYYVERQGYYIQLNLGGRVYLLHLAKSRKQVKQLFIGAVSVGGTVFSCCQGVGQTKLWLDIFSHTVSICSWTPPHTHTHTLPMDACVIPLSITWKGSMRFGHWSPGHGCAHVNNAHLLRTKFMQAALCFPQHRIWV